VPGLFTWPTRKPESTGALRGDAQLEVLEHPAQLGLQKIMKMFIFEARNGKRPDLPK